MELIRALDVMPGVHMALVGSGGKTTAMFALARQLPPPVLVTATTHLGHDQLSKADVCFVVNAPEELPEIDQLDLEGVNLFVGPPSEAWRTSGVSPSTYHKLEQLAIELSASLLVESDGSRQKPLKAPAEHEPPVPGGVDCVVVVAGLSALGQSLVPELVHRPDYFALLSGLEPMQTITVEALDRVLAHPQGGLKNIPPASRKILLLNQADTPQLQAAGASLAGKLTGIYERVVVAALNPPPGAEQNLDPRLTSESTQPGRVFAAYTRLGAVILAAGESRRYGAPKQLLTWRGEPFVRVIARTALDAGFDPVVVVMGFSEEAVSHALTSLPVQLCHNPAWKDGQSTSIKAGLAVLENQVGGCLFLLADMPQVGVPLLRSLVEEHARTGAAVIAPMVDGQRTNPVLFGKITFPDLLELRGDQGGRGIFSRYQPHYFPWHDHALLLDVDTPEDYQRLQEAA
jgi:molybdenum cofactor cytidylyltransferase